MSRLRITIPVEGIEQSIYLIRGRRVILDRDLAALYEIPTKALKQAVRRNLKRFPKDFMFVLDQSGFSSGRHNLRPPKKIRFRPKALKQ